MCMNSICSVCKSLKIDCFKAIINKLLKNKELAFLLPSEFYSWQCRDISGNKMYCIENLSKTTN